MSSRAQIPSPEAPLPDILQFAITYDGYARMDGGPLDVAEATDGVRRHLAEHGDVPIGASEESLRAALFFLQRQTHHWGDVPAEYENQMRTLVAAISDGNKTGFVTDDHFG